MALAGNVGQRDRMWEDLEGEGVWDFDTLEGNDDDWYAATE